MIIVILIILLCFVKKDNSSVEEVKQEKPVEFSTEPTSEEIPKEENSETEESTEVDIIKEVKIGVDFRFDTKQNGTITVNGNGGGSNTFAQGGGNNIDDIELVFKHIEDVLNGILGTEQKSQ